MNKGHLTTSNIYNLPPKIKEQLDFNVYDEKK